MLHLIAQPLLETVARINDLSTKPCPRGTDAPRTPGAQHPDFAKAAAILELVGELVFGEEVFEYWHCGIPGYEMPNNFYSDGISMS
jgi:hypothetical protein